MSNPWEEIDLTIYERHMGLESVYQLQLLNQMMKEQFDAYDINTIMLLGIAGGNGLEHIDAGKIKKVYGVDVNSKFLAECKNRYPALGDGLETICTDLLNDNLQLPCADMLVANLLIEYIGYECFQKVVRLVKPQYVSCVIQINTDSSYVSESPYLHSFDCLHQVHHQMSEADLCDSMREVRYEMGYRQERLLPNGKKFLRMDFVCKG